MLDDTLALMSPMAFAMAFIVTLCAGFVKGAVGFAVPLIMISGLTLFLEPTLAVAALILPATLSNFLQVARFGWSDIVSVTREFWRYIAIVAVMIFLVAQVFTLMSPQVFYLIVGVPVMILSLIQFLGLRFRIAPAWRRVTEVGVALLAGGLGGMTGTWGPPTVLYLIALETPKAKQFLVQGVVYGLASLTLLLGHVQSGVLNATTAPLSVALLVPAFLGMLLGGRFSDRLDAEKFRKLTLLILIIAGANLVRRGLFG